jgi:hypothetical protein
MLIEHRFEAKSRVKACGTCKLVFKNGKDIVPPATVMREAGWAVADGSSGVDADRVLASLLEAENWFGKDEGRPESSAESNADALAFVGETATEPNADQAKKAK